MLRRPASFFALTILALFIGGCTGSGASPSAPIATAGESPLASSGTGFDQAFIDMMVPHHQSAVEMAKIAQERAGHGEIRELAGEIIAAQDAEIAQLRGWRTVWFGTDATPPMDAVPMLPGMGMEGHSMGDTMDMTTDIDALRTADPFDKAFIEAMIPHHESAIEAARLAEEQAERPEIRELAGEIIAAQEREITQMNAWLEEWY